MKFGKLALALAVAALSSQAFAQTGTTLTYKASGTFASKPSSGPDPLELAGQPFTVNITVNSSTPPSQTGRNWALYSNLQLTGTVYSGLLAGIPVSIASRTANIQQFIDPGQYDVLKMGAPLRVVGIKVNIVADITLPNNTLTGALIQTFNPVSLTPNNASLTYYQDNTVTTLPIQSGSVKSTSN